MNFRPYKCKLFFVFTFLFVLNIAKAQGPNAPEAASFEPVDATDMVNLVTGNMSYVLPLLNVPSPEGGYPIALSYHSGIAMDQEASWVGLGWSLNPGTINRGVNGYPDDWGKTNINEFYYDVGWDEDYYSFSAGVTIKGKISVGLGLSWGTNQSMGGYVDAGIGFGSSDVGARIEARIGTDGMSINGSYNGFTASIGTNGVGLNYGTKGDNRLGLSLNYNYNSGLSGGISLTSNISGSTSKSAFRTVGMGISFSSKGISGNLRANGKGIGISTQSRIITNTDYGVIVTSTKLYLPIYMFYVGYSHTNVEYSLFKYNNLYTSGILYPVVPNELKPYKDSPDLSRLLQENHFMDVSVFPRYGDRMSTDDFLESSYDVDKNNLVLPSYDNYSVSAQGLSGKLRPYFHTELNLSGRGRGEKNKEHIYAAYLNNSYEEYTSAPSSGIDANRDAVKRVNFTLDNVYNSFLRMDRTNIYKPSFFNDVANVGDNTVLKYFKTDESNKFTNYNSLTNTYEAKKREANYIKTYTNKEIRDSYYDRDKSTLPNFIDAVAYNTTNLQVEIDRSNKDVFLDEGIGAYQITTADGKTYHYSLPVYNFESYYKNFENRSNENEKFFEIQKSAPYATHWLLTAVTGPDYIDVNDNGKLDSEDYGYWVSFEYGKWSDGYIWETPNGRLEESETKSGDKTYSYSWGRKQIYYLDAIKTRTHSALFIKDIREDHVSHRKYHYTSRHTDYDDLESFSLVNNSKLLQTNTQKMSQGIYYLNDEEEYLPIKVDDIRNGPYYLHGKKRNYKYIDFPRQKTLALSKIILVKNEKLIAFINKNNNSLIDRVTGAFLQINGYTEVNYLNAYGDPALINGLNNPFENKELFSKLKRKPVVFQGQFSGNILDVKDIENLDLESKASQVIEFDYSYDLAKGSSNSTAKDKGRLTLNKLFYKGKGGVSLLPPYQFDYSNKSVLYNADNIDDWGYRENVQYLWSLNNITTPTGGKIKIDYESDSYYAEAAFSEEKSFTIVDVSSSGNELRLYVGDNTESLLPYFKINRYYDINYDVTVYVEDRYDGSTIIQTSEKREQRRKVTAIGENWIEFSISNSNELLDFDPANPCQGNGRERECIDDVQITGLVDNYSPERLGGGLRTKAITVSDGTNNIVKTSYKYEGGITSYAPSKDPKFIPYASELPSPMVMYGKVTMENFDRNDKLLGSTSYKFETLKPFSFEVGSLFNLGPSFRVVENQNERFFGDKIEANKFTIENRLGNVGRLLSVSSYNSKGQLLSKKVNNYKVDLDSDREIGVTQETHKSVKRVLKTTDLDEYFLISSTSKVSYPSVLESTKTTSGGFERVIHCDKYDFLTGKVLETRSYLSDGKIVKSKVVPAYKKYSNMGSKIDNTMNKNMLAQETANYTYLLDRATNTEKIVSANITTWNNIWQYRDYITNGNSSPRSYGIWRMHKTYIWNGELNTDGTYKNFTGEDDGFVWGVGQPQTNSRWKNTSTITMYNRYSMPLESKDITSNYVSTKMGDNQSKVIAVSNAKYTEMYYSGAEYLAKNTTYFDGEVKSFGQTPVSNAHTGNFIVRIGTGQKGFEVTLPPNNLRTGIKKQFKVSVWVRKGNESNAKINVAGKPVDFNDTERVYAGNWVLLNGTITIPETATTVYITSIGNSLDLDDFKLHPVQSSMTSYVYNEWDELWYTIGSNGLAIRYKYDNAGRLTETAIELADFKGSESGGFKPVKEIEYTNKLTVQMDTNGNGIIDLQEQYDKLSLNLGITDFVAISTKVIAHVNGGSGEFEYRWAQSDSFQNLNYGPWKNFNSISISTYCPDGRRYYKCQVRDKVTALTIESSGSHLRDCRSGGDDGNPIEQQH